MFDYEDIFKLCIIFAVTILLVAFPIATAYADLSVSYGTLTVTEKIGAHGEDGAYLIVSEDGQMYTVADNYLQLKFDASDRYAGLKTGKTYRTKFTGFRNHLLSWYKNIIEYEEV